MSENKWTPGPWEWSTANDPLMPFALYGGPKGFTEVLMAESGPASAWIEVRRADKELIAAAPDLYATCHKAWLKLDAEGDDLADELFAVLTKARGQ